MRPTIGVEPLEDPPRTKRIRIYTWIDGRRLRTKTGIPDTKRIRGKGGIFAPHRPRQIRRGILGIHIPTHPTSQEGARRGMIFFRDCFYTHPPTHPPRKSLVFNFLTPPRPRLVSCLAQERDLFGWVIGWLFVCGGARRILFSTDWSIDLSIYLCDRFVYLFVCCICIIVLGVCSMSFSLMFRMRYHFSRRVGSAYIAPSRFSHRVPVIAFHHFTPFRTA